jgi:hypothetical protein
MDLYARWMDSWEQKLASRDKNRHVREFDWGLDWLERLGANGTGPEPARVDAFTAASLAESARFFAYQVPADFQLSDGILSFTSAVETPYPENNRMWASFLPCPGGNRAVLVLPQWNADEQAHISLCKLLNRFGLAALRMTLPYHARRRPAVIERAEYHVSSNVGRTIHACRQAVIDARSCLDWLQSRGYTKVGILGTSLGSCIAFIAAAHDSRISAGAFNHVSGYFGDVVWTGLSTQHVRRSLESAITQEELRRYWAVISPASYLDRMNGRDFRSLLVWARHDSSFLPQFSSEIIQQFATLGLQHEVKCLPCGHYTIGRFPFNWLDGLTLCRFLGKNL